MSGGQMADNTEWQEEQLIEQLEHLAAVTKALAQEVNQLQQWHPLAGGLRHLLWRSFLQGTASGLGRAVGATVVLALLVWLLGQLEVVPVLGAWIVQLAETIRETQQGF